MNCILQLRGGILQESIPVNEGESIIGRDSDAAIQLGDETVSRHHCRIMNLPNVCTIEDLNSANGTFVNGRRINSQTSLRQGDEIRLGSCSVIFEEVRSEVFDDTGRSKDYSTSSRNSTLRFKRSPAETTAPRPPPAAGAKPQIIIKKKA